MLKLKLKPSYELGETEIQIYDLFVSKDLTFISGRTSAQNCIYDGEELKVVNNNNQFISTFRAEAENVIVKGKVFYKKTLEVKSIKRLYNVMDGLYGKIVELENTYVENDGDICFYCEKLGGYTVNHSFYSANKTDKSIEIETFAYIEGDYAVVDGKKYYVDFSDKSMPLKTFPEEYSITDVILYDAKKFKRETKFILRKKYKVPFAIEECLYGGYENYVVYKNRKETFSYLYKKDSSGDMNSIGYGVELDGVIFTDENINFNSLVDEIFKIHKDIDISGSNIQIGEDNYLVIQSDMCTYSSDGNFMFLITNSDRLDIHEGNYITAESTFPVKINYSVDTDNDGNDYVLYNGKKYDVIENLYDYITISDVDYQILYDNDSRTEAHAFVNGNTMYFTVNQDKYKISSNGSISCEGESTVYFGRTVKTSDLAIPTNKIYYVDDGSEYVKYGKIEGYEIHHSYGIKVDDVFYRVIEEYNDEKELLNRYVTINDYQKYDLYVDGVNGSKTYICEPYIDISYLEDDFEIDAKKRSICKIIINNLDSFTFTVRDDIFGERKGYPENFLYDSTQLDSPVNFMGSLNLSFFKINAYINAKLPFINGVGNNILKEDAINNVLLSDIKNKSYNSIVDMEKDVYYPVFFDGVNYNPIKEIRFNMHFRTRQLDNWKVIEDYNELKAEIAANPKISNNSNWFVCDYSYYQMAGREGARLQNVSDLVGYMNFTDSEVRNMAKKISKSFLRLSFYSTPDPNTQVLLGTSTIFMDEALLARKMFTYTEAAEKTYIRTQYYQSLVLDADEDMYTANTCSVDGEVFKDYKFKDEFRLSSRITVKDKYNSDTSSEGFYFYMFREFSDSMRPKRIYLKIDFNHAGIGRTIPFIIPREFLGENDEDGTPLYLHDETDLAELKKGFELKDIYKQLFIPIDVIYDDKNNRYVYYLPEALRENYELGVSDDIMEFNLFEIKFKDESIQNT